MVLLEVFVAIGVLPFFSRKIAKRLVLLSKVSFLPMKLVDEVQDEDDQESQENADERSYEVWIR